MNEAKYTVEMPRQEAKLKQLDMQRYVSAFAKKRDELIEKVIERCVGRKLKMKDYLDFQVKHDFLTGGYEIFYLKNKVGRIEFEIIQSDDGAKMSATFIPSPPAYVA